MLNKLLKNTRTVEISQGIFSTLGDSGLQSRYDRKVLAYDAVVGNRFYNKFFWGNWPSSYQKFCEQALHKSTDKPMLDAGCGSLVFTARAYAEVDDRFVVLLDRSHGMLKRARERLIKARGAVPDNIAFLQSDIFQLPFIDNAFGSVMSQGLLHMFNQKQALLSELQRVKAEDGFLAITSLVGNNRLAQRYLSVLERAGEVAAVDTSATLKELLTTMPTNYKMCTQGNIAYIKGH